MVMEFVANCNISFCMNQIIMANWLVVGINLIIHLWDQNYRWYVFHGDMEWLIEMEAQGKIINWEPSHIQQNMKIKKKRALPLIHLHCSDKYAFSTNNYHDKK